MAVMEMYDKIAEAMERNNFSMGVFFDLSKAFDTVNHKILLSIKIGLRGVYDSLNLPIFNLNYNFNF